MSSEDQIINIFKDGLGDCPSFEVKLNYARGMDISDWDTDHIKLCPLCQKEIGVLKNEELPQEEVLGEDTVLAIQKIEKELVTNKYSKAITLCETFVWDHSSKENELKILNEILLVRSEMLIQRKNWSSALKLLEFCKGNIKLEDARAFYLLARVFGNKGDISTSEKFLKKAREIDSDIEEQYMESKGLTLNIKNVVIKIIQKTDTLIKSSKLLVEEIIEGPGELLAVGTRGGQPDQGEITKKLELKGLELTTITTKLDKPELEIKTDTDEVTLVNSDGKPVPGEKVEGKFTFHMK